MSTAKEEMAAVGGQADPAALATSASAATEMDSSPTAIDASSGAASPTDPAELGLAAADGAVAVLEATTTSPATLDNNDDSSLDENASDAGIDAGPETKTTADTGTGVSPDVAEPVVKMVSYHYFADLYVEAREPAGIVVYSVCSAVVAAASRAWRKKIRGGEVGPDASGKLILGLADDPDGDGFGLDILFSIMHLKFHGMPDRPDVDQLYGLARVAEKYDCAHLLAPYMEKWVAGLHWHIAMNNQQNLNDDDKTLYLTWVFGEGGLFARMVTRVAHKAMISDDGVLLDTRGQPWKDQGLPLAIVDLMTKIRYISLAKIVEAIDQPLQDLLATGSNGTVSFCRAKDAPVELKEACQLQLLGSLVVGLTACGLLPFPSLDSYRGSVADLVEKLQGIKIARFKLPGLPPHLDGHMNCGIKHKDSLKTITGENAKLGGDVIQELKVRARKSGAFRAELFKELEEMEACVAVADASEDVMFSRNIFYFKQVTYLPRPSVASSSVEDVEEGVGSEDLEA